MKYPNLQTLFLSLLTNRKAMLHKMLKRELADLNPTPLRAETRALTSPMPFFELHMYQKAKPRKTQDSKSNEEMKNTKK